MAVLREVAADSPGWTRRRAGRGFTYLDQDGQRLSDREIDRIKDLVIPPAWTDVWICPDPDGHLQATGTDAAGRRQYLYHPQWRIQRDAEKFDRVLAASRRLPKLRRMVAADLLVEGVPLPRASALAVQLLDRGYFRVGNDVYADENGSFGLTTLLRSHVRRRGNLLVFSFPGKSGVEHSIEVDDATVLPVLQAMRRRRGGERLLSYRQGRRWADLTSEHVNTYLGTHFRGGFTAKDFRTWHATVLAALAVAEASLATARSGTALDERARTRIVRSAVVQAAEYLGNTPTVARSSYIDPRIFEAFEAGERIPVPRATDPIARRDRAERSVRRLLQTTAPA